MSLTVHSLQVGSRGPLYCSALGKAMLAFLPQQQVDDILKSGPRIALTKQTKTKLSDIMDELERTRRTGIGRSQGEAIAGVDGFAAPVFNAAGVPVAALGVGIPTSELRQPAVMPIETALKRAAQKLSRQLGWRAELVDQLRGPSRERTRPLIGAIHAKQS